VSAAAGLAFGEPTGQGWPQVVDLAIAFVLSLAVGLEREAQQKSAGVRTYPLVGLGSALFVLISKYGFSDVLGAHVTLDPSRVAAQIVSGLGFIGGGLIFVRRDAVRGLTTAASVWLTAAIGAAAGAGLPVLAAVTTALYFVVLYALRPLTRWARRRRPDSVALRVTYLDGRGVLREVLNTATGHGFAIADVATLHVGSAGAERGRDDHRDRDVAATERDATVDVTLVLTGRGDLSDLTEALSGLDGVRAVRTSAAADE
jgi:putative Mg2+ transporter-C (MgtC) family protein